MLAVSFFVASGSGVSPYGLHLFTAVFGLHVGVVEDVVGTVAFLGFGCPVDEFGGVCERAAAEIWRWVGFLPDDVVE